MADNTRTLLCNFAIYMSLFVQLIYIFYNCECVCVCVLYLQMTLQLIYILRFVVVVVVIVVITNEICADVLLGCI